MLTREETAKEEWRDVVGYEGIYKVSNKGRISGRKGLMKIQISSLGYQNITLCKKGVSKKYQLHRIVAFAFIPNIQNKPQINHIDGVKTNNCVENLEWCTMLENRRHAVINGLHGCRRNPVYIFNMSGELVKKTKSVEECAEYVGCTYQNITKCILKNRPHKDFLFSYSDTVTIPTYKYKYEVAEIDSFGNIMNTYESTRKAALALGLNSSSFIRLVCEGKYSHYKGHKFKYT